jgi:hypothetical protein
MRNTYRELSKSGFSLSMLSEGNEWPFVAERC